MKAFAIGFGGFALAAAVYYGGLVAYGHYQKEQIKERVLVDLACQSVATQAKFGIQCPAGNASPPAPDTK